MRIFLFLSGVLVCLCLPAQTERPQNFLKTDSALHNLELDSVVVVYSQSVIHFRQRDSTYVSSVITSDSSMTVELHGLQSSCGDEFYYEYHVDKNGILIITVHDFRVCQGGYSTTVVLHFRKYPEKIGPQITGVRLVGCAQAPLPIRGD